MSIRKYKREKMVAKAAAANFGDGMYIFQNITNSDLFLSRPTKAGRRMIGPRQKFVGDSYYKNMKDIICLQEVEKPMSEQKQVLLTEVPPTVTTQGAVEYVQNDPELKPINEELEDEQKQKEILLNESPVAAVKVDGVRIMR